MDIYKNHLLEAAEKINQPSIGADVKFIDGSGKVLYCHSFMLCISDYFKTIIRRKLPQTIKGEMIEITVSDIDTTGIIIKYGLHIITF